MPSLLFICTANICRSPMASALFQIICLEKHDMQSWRVESAGTWSHEGDPAVEGTKSVMKSRGIDISSHRSRLVRKEIIEEFDLILTMERGHKEALQYEFPSQASRIYMLSEIVGLEFDIKDPFGGPLAGYEKTANEIEMLLRDGFNTILSLVSNNYSG